MVPTSVNLQLHTFSSPGYQSIVDQAVEFFGKTPVHSLPPPVNFPGVGVYAIYYFGEFECYQHLVVANRKQCRFPIYVGKAVPRGWRTGRVRTSDNEQHLYSRLREHERSIAHGAGFVAGDFRCRFVILGEMETDLISSIESRMIRKFDPLWNTTVDGFGNHDPGSGRYSQARSEWDVLHPGRPWADRLTGTPPQRGDVLAKIHQRFRNSTTAS